jgi:hypothetical protein
MVGVMIAKKVFGDTIPAAARMRTISISLLTSSTRKIMRQSLIEIVLNPLRGSTGLDSAPV